jgi:hypothetical protein
VAKRLLVVGIAVAMVAALIVAYIQVWATELPQSVAATSGAAGGGVNLTLETVAAVGPGPSPEHPDWVSYLIRQNGKWIHSTIFKVPAHSLVHVTIYQFDSATGLRNPFLAEAQGTTSGETVNGKLTAAINPDDASHTFAVPQLGVFVPLPGVSATAKNPCGYGPCSTSFDHMTITFTFRTGGKGRLRWQCFVPCGAGTLLGNGGPMQTFGYMAGFLDVV